MKIAAGTFAVLYIALASPVANAKEGAQATPVDKNNKPVGPSIPLPDCRSCKVEKTGPNQYEIRVPDRVKEKAKASTPAPAPNPKR